MKRKELSIVFASFAEMRTFNTGKFGDNIEMDLMEVNSQAVRRV
jgi:hypothetical protein